MTWYSCDLFCLSIMYGRVMRFPPRSANQIENEIERHSGPLSQCAKGRVEPIGTIQKSSQLIRLDADWTAPFAAQAIARLLLRYFERTLVQQSPIRSTSRRARVQAKTDVMYSANGLQPSAPFHCIRPRVDETDQHFLITLRRESKFATYKGVCVRSKLQTDCA
ncbi:hypothetical protein HBI47_250940 [Parastagonospora nodorum]|nr:hypothetical protein HBI47_250940 [Parastagonospora nodorum]